MMTRLAVAFVMANLFVCNAFAEEEKTDPRTELKTAIPEAIRLIDGKDYEGFAKTFMPPEKMKEVEKQGILGVVVKAIESQSADILKALNEIKDAEPELDEKGEAATYKLSKPIGGNDEMSFSKIDGLWYLGK